MGGNETMKHWKYLKYLLRHKWYVAVECCKRGLYLHAFSHDLSKFRPSEWFPYVNYFYGDYPSWDDVKIKCVGYPYKGTKEGVEKAFDYAWLLHQKRNKHHWQFFVLMEDEGQIKTLHIPYKIIVQMACDWIGATKAIRGKNASPVDWYEKVKDGTKMADQSRKIFEALIGYKERKL